jgi:alanine-synthesizing transaminase
MMEGLSGTAWGKSTQELQVAKSELLAKGIALCDLSMVNPDIAPPRFLIDKLCEASVKSGNHRYAVSRGIRRLREAFCHRYQTVFGVKVDPGSEICVTLGTKDAFTQICLTLLKPGDDVLVGTPMYPAFRFIAAYAGLRLHSFTIEQDEECSYNNLAAAFAQRVPRALFLNFPNNPTGLVVTSKWYERVLDLARQHQCLVVNDFVYGEMTYEQQPLSLLRVAQPEDVVLETYSLSKAYSVPGWRVGAVLGSRSLIQDIATAKSRVDYGLFLPLQIASSAALLSAEPFARTITAQYRNRSRVLQRVLSNAGWRVSKPEGGACVWAEAPEHLAPFGSDRIVAALLEHGLVAASGELFGCSDRACVRFALVAPEDRLQQLEPMFQGLVI